jgi:hypothetical protein
VCISSLHCRPSCLLCLLLSLISSILSLTTHRHPSSLLCPLISSLHATSTPSHLLSCRCTQGLHRARGGGCSVRQTVGQRIRMKEVTQRLEFWVGSTTTRVLVSHLTIFNALLVAVLITVHSFFPMMGTYYKTLCTASQTQVG